MKFAITCPGCAKQFRSSTERPIGKGVECPKCGEQFYVTAENQAEVRSAAPPPVAAANREDDHDRQSRRRPRDDDEDDAPRRRNRRDHDDDFDDDRRPRRKSGSGKKLVVILGIAGLLMFTGLGIGAYLLFFSGGGSAAKKVRPPRDLPDDMFAYVPTSAYKVEYDDYDLAHQTGQAPSQAGLDFVLPKSAGIAVDQVALRCTSSAAMANDIEITLLSFKGPQDVTQLAARSKFQLRPGDRKNVYTGRDGFTEWAIFQPAPTKIVFVKAPLARPLDQKKLAAVLESNPTSSNLTPTMREGLAAVSGYPIIRGFDKGNVAGPEAKAEFTGMLTTDQQVKEMYSFQWFQNDVQAKAWFKMPSPVFKESQKPEGELEKKDWLEGDKIFHYQRMQLKK